MFGGGTSTEYDDIVSKSSHVYPIHIAGLDSDSLSDKTTDENLTSENWELILNLCDKVQDEGQTGYASQPLVTPTRAKLTLPLCAAAAHVYLYLQGPQCDCGHPEAPRAPQPERAAVRAVADRVAEQEPGHRNPSRAGVQSVHPGPREAHHRSGTHVIS